jgi:hypothetical protein
VLAAPEGQVDALVENMTLHLTYWLNYDRLLHAGRAAQVSIHQGVLQLLTMIAPYLGGDQLEFYRQCETIYRNMIRSEA